MARHALRNGPAAEPFLGQSHEQLRRYRAHARVAAAVNDRILVCAAANRAFGGYHGDVSAARSETRGLRTGLDYADHRHITDALADGSQSDSRRGVAGDDQA